MVVRCLINLRRCKVSKRIVFESNDKRFRILEVADEAYSLEELKGDCYNPDVNPDIPDLAEQERKFERTVSDEGVFGYILERWNPAPGIGFEHVDSCWGFVGMYDPKIEFNNHYIVAEMLESITRFETKETENE